jgi:simple sugar transport system ATP-binding protein
MVESYSIADNLVLNTYKHRPFTRGMVRQAATITAYAARLMQTFDIRAPSPLTRAGSLSGGNQQKLVVARECSRPMTLLIAAQPTRGLDIGAMTFIHQHMVQQCDRGCAVLLVSADLDEVLTLSDRIAIMYQGKLIAVVEAHTATREELGRLMAGLSRA